jgi:hypothetical protein
VEHFHNGVLLTQEKYALDILTHVGMLNYKSVSTSLLASTKVSQHEGDPLGPEDTTRYRNVVWAPQYLSLTLAQIWLSLLTRYANTLMH